MALLCLLMLVGLPPHVLSLPSPSFPMILRGPTSNCTLLEPRRRRRTTTHIIIFSFLIPLIPGIFLKLNTRFQFVKRDSDWGSNFPRVLNLRLIIKIRIVQRNSWPGSSWTSCDSLSNRFFSSSPRWSWWFWCDMQSPPAPPQPQPPQLCRLCHLSHYRHHRWCAWCIAWKKKKTVGWQHWAGSRNRSWCWSWGKRQQMVVVAEKN